MNSKHVDPSHLGWGGYSKWEGPWFRGNMPFTITAPKTYSEKVLKIFTATEGGSWNALNCYDIMILSLGAFQWADAGTFAVCDMLGYVHDRDPAALEELIPAMKASNVTFEKNAVGKWRFKFADARGWVDTVAKQHQMYQLNSEGLKGTWDEPSKDRIRLWGACMVNVMTHEGAIQAQIDYTTSHFMGFVTKDAKAVLWGPDTPQGEASNIGWVGAIRAGYLSFAGNLPAVAAKQLALHVSTTQDPIFSEGWCVGLLKRLTFGPNITIFPIRYDAIRPVIEAEFGVNLPDFAKELAEWKSQQVPVSEPNEPGFFTPKEIQALLLELGYDLGPSGADGVVGPKTKAAVVDFQTKHLLDADGVVGPKTRPMLLLEWRRIHLKP